MVQNSDRAKVTDAVEDMTGTRKMGDKDEEEILDMVGAVAYDGRWSMSLESWMLASMLSRKIELWSFRVERTEPTEDYLNMSV